MTSFLLNQWRFQPGGPQNPSMFIFVNSSLNQSLSAPFMLSLEDGGISSQDKVLIIKTFDDWEVLTSTWFEVADYLTVIEKLSEDKNFPERKRAALLASKVAYCLGDYVGALQLALGAEDLFSLKPRDAHAVFGPQDELVSYLIHYNYSIYQLFVFSLLTKLSNKQ